MFQKHHASGQDLLPIMKFKATAETAYVGASVLAAARPFLFLQSSFPNWSVCRPQLGTIRPRLQRRPTFGQQAAILGRALTPNFYPFQGHQAQWNCKKSSNGVRFLVTRKLENKRAGLITDPGDRVPETDLLSE